MLPPLTRKSRHWRRAAIKRAYRLASIWRSVGNRNSQHTKSTHGRSLERGAWRGNPRQVPEIDYDFDPPEIAGDTPVALAASEVFRTENVLTRKALLHRSFVEAALRGRGIKTVYSEISNLEASGRLVRLDDHEAAQHWTTTAIAAEEAKLLRLAKERVPGSLFRPEAVEVALQAAPFLSDEQRRAIRHATSPDPTTILEAGAGTGKTTLIAGLVDAARRSGASKS